VGPSVDDDHYEQPGILFRKMSREQQRLLFENTARHGRRAPRAMQRHIANCTKADPPGAGRRRLGVGARSGPQNDWFCEQGAMA
jgi:catalase